MAYTGWESVRLAIAAKIAASAGCAAAGLRKATTSTEETLSPPQVIVLEASYQLTQQVNAQTEQYDLTIPAELLVPRPSGRQRAAPTASAIARAIQVEWQTGITLGLSPQVWGSELQSWEPDLDEYRDTELIGGRLIFLVHVYETISGRTV